MLRLLKLIWDTMWIDTTSLIPHSSHDPLYPSVLLEYSAKRKHSGAQWRHFILFLKHMLRNFLHRGEPLGKTPKGEVFLLAMSKNQEHSLLPIERHLKERTPSRLWTREQVRRLWVWGYPLAIPFLPCMLWRWATSKGYARKSFRWSIDQYWLNYGLYLVGRLWFWRAAPRAIVFANDHSQISCVLAAAASAENIPTFYVQHACVTDAFPPLTTTFALLDGLDAVQKYDRIGLSNTEVFTVGITKFDSYVSRIRDSNGLRRVGICFNKADELTLCRELLNRMAEYANELSFTATVRPHPRMEGKSLAAIAQHASELRFEWSDPASESPFDFLCAQDVILCGMSAIALEAALVNVVPINFVMSEDFTDWYGFAKQGLCRSTSSFEELRAWLVEVSEGNATPVRETAKHYSATVGTEWDGKSAYLAAQLILWKSCDGPPVEVAPIATSQLKAYQPL